MMLVVVTMTSNFVSAAPHDPANAPPVRRAPPAPGPSGPNAVGSTGAGIDMLAGGRSIAFSGPSW